MEIGYSPEPKTINTAQPQHADTRATLNPFMPGKGMLLTQSVYWCGWLWIKHGDPTANLQHLRTVTTCLRFPNDPQCHAVRTVLESKFGRILLLLYPGLWSCQGRSYVSLIIHQKLPSSMVKGSIMISCPMDWIDCAIFCFRVKWGKGGSPLSYWFHPCEVSLVILTQESDTWAAELLTLFAWHATLQIKEGKPLWSFSYLRPQNKWEIQHPFMIFTAKNKV